MEYQKITILLGKTPDGHVDDRYKPSKQIRFKTSMVWSDLCDFSDVYIVVKGTITLTNDAAR